MCPQKLVGIMALAPQPFHFCGTRGGIGSDCSGEVPRSVLEKADLVPVIIHQGVAGLAHHGRTVFVLRPMT
jgi:hypothetical protein